MNKRHEEFLHTLPRYHCTDLAKVLKIKDEICLQGLPAHISEPYHDLTKISYMLKICEHLKTNKINESGYLEAVVEHMIFHLHELKERSEPHLQLAIGEILTYLTTTPQAYPMCHQSWESWHMAIVRDKYPFTKATINTFNPDWKDGEATNILNCMVNVHNIQDFKTFLFNHSDTKVPSIQLSSKIICDVEDKSQILTYNDSPTGFKDPDFNLHWNSYMAWYAVYFMLAVCKENDYITDQIVILIPLIKGHFVKFLAWLDLQPDIIKEQVIPKSSTKFLTHQILNLQADYSVSKLLLLQSHISLCKHKIKDIN